MEIALALCQESNFKKEKKRKKKQYLGLPEVYEFGGYRPRG